MTRTERPSPNPLMYHRFHNTLSIEKKKQTRLSVAEKLQLLKKYEAGVSVKSLCEEYGVKKQTVSDIKKDKERLKQWSATSNNLGRTSMKVADHCFKLSLSFFISLTVCFLIPYSSQRLFTETPASYYFNSCSFSATERRVRFFFSIDIELDALALMPELDGLLWKYFEIGVGAMMLIRYKLV